MACTSWLGERQVGSSAEKRENSGGEGFRKGVVVVVVVCVCVGRGGESESVAICVSTHSRPTAWNLILIDSCLVEACV